MNWSVIAWSIGAVSLTVSVVAQIADFFLRKSAAALTKSLPVLQVLMTIASVVAFTVAQFTDPLRGTTPTILIGTVGLVVIISVAYLGVILVVTAFRSGKARRRCTCSCEGCSYHQSQMVLT